MKISFKHVLAAALITTFAAGVAHAERGDKTPEERQAKMEERFEKRFTEMDQNNDGVITQQEMRDAYMKKADKHFEKMDNGDGKLTKEEMKESAKKFREKFKGKHHGMKHKPEPKAQ